MNRQTQRWVTSIVHEASADSPQNWSELYRWYLTGVAGLTVLNSTFASSSPSGIIEGMRETFGFSQEVAILTISLFVAGYCVGPLLWGPLSERYARLLHYSAHQAKCV